MTNEDIDPSLEAIVLSCGNMEYSVQKLGTLLVNTMEQYNELTVPDTTQNLHAKFQQAKDTKWFGKFYSSLDSKVQDQLQIDLLSQGEKAELQSQAMRALVNWTEECGWYTYNEIKIGGVEYVVGGDMKDAKEPTPEKAQFGPYF